MCWSMIKEAEEQEKEEEVVVVVVVVEEEEEEKREKGDERNNFMKWKRCRNYTICVYYVPYDVCSGMLWELLPYCLVFCKNHHHYPIQPFFSGH